MEIARRRGVDARAAPPRAGAFGGRTLDDRACRARGAARAARRDPVAAAMDAASRELVRGARTRNTGNRGIGDRSGHRHDFSPCRGGRSEEHTSELQSLMRISYADFCLKKKK